MDWKEIVRLKPDKLNEENRDAVFEALVGFEDFERADNKTFKRLFKISHQLMKWKGVQVGELTNQLKEKSLLQPQELPRIDPEKGDSDPQSENVKLRKLVERLENEKSQQRVKFRQLTEEVQLLQKRVQNTREIENEDSPDVLSDLEKQEELLANISVKNKHIKRLLADLEELEAKQASQTKENQFLRHQLQEATLSLESLNAQFKDAQTVIKDQMELTEELHSKNRHLDDLVQSMQKDKDVRESEINAFGRELEKRASVWKRMLDQKQSELESLKVKYEDIIDRHPGYNIDAERAELTRMTMSVKERDSLIQDLETKVFEMSNELITATEVINKLLLKERQLNEKHNRPRSADCCQEAKDMLELAKRELVDLRENLLALEEENIVKSKQAMEATDRFLKYENGEEGLPEALKRITELERKVRIRDKDIKDLVKQINRSQDVAKENIALREQLGVEESEIVPTTFVEAKLRKLEKANERLTMKCRASEEMRLKMKLDRNELMKQLNRVHQEEDHSSSPESDQVQDIRSDRKLRSALEELKKKEGKWLKERSQLEENYEIILKENENLRVGMHDILNKLRECDGSTNQLTMDDDILNRLLSVLDHQHSTAPAVELAVLKTVTNRETQDQDTQTVFETISNVKDVDQEKNSLSPEINPQDPKESAEIESSVKTLSQEDYAGLVSQLQELRVENEELNRSNHALKDLLRVNQEQLSSDKIADGQIAFVADLQSSGNEKQLIDRAHRELDIDRLIPEGSVQSAPTAPFSSSGNTQDQLDKPAKKDPPPDLNEDRVNLIKYKTHCGLLELELNQMKERIQQLEQDLQNQSTNIHREGSTEIGIQVVLDSGASYSRNDPEIPVPSRSEDQRELTFSMESMADHRSLESQLKQAMILASTRSALLLETENRLAEAQGRLKGIERCLEERDRLIKEERANRTGLELDKRDESVFSITIASLQNLLLEKDTTLSRYQDLLKTERLEHSKSCSEHNTEIDRLKSQCEELTKKIKERDIVVEELKENLSHVERLHEGEVTLSSHQITERDIEKGAREVDEDDRDISLIDSNKFIDEVFIDESKEFELAEKQMEIQELESRLKQSDEEIRRLQGQLMEVSKREGGWEAALAEKDREIENLSRKVKDGGKRQAINFVTPTDVDQLRDLLEEKDRHINDLTETLTHFHDDQQNFMKDTSLNSAEDMARLTSELSRSEATNKVLNTQIEAIKRQIGNLEKREKQARELVKTLKTQLIQRPVISVGKTLQKEDQYQRKIETLQADLAATREELRKQTNLAEQRRSKGQQDLQLWEKHKRAQQNGDKLKVKLSEREQELEKLKCQLAVVRQTVSRLEREKQVMESKRVSGGGHSCQSASCPSQGGASNKENRRRPAAETPETDQTDDDDNEEMKYYGEIAVTAVPKQWQEQNNEVIKALKSRIEFQQRKIVAMELEGKGSNIISMEMEKIQERVANLESQNLRLDAKNLQLQLENDLLRNGDEAERQRRQIRHLEDYILVLKEELSQAIAVASTVDQSVKQGRIFGPEQGGKTTGNMEQTILALKRIVERLRFENKSLKEGKSGVVVGGPAKNVLQKTQQELKRYQDLYAEALNKISNESGPTKLDGTPRDNELKTTTAKLEQKTQLLEKAKILLTRAAAKERNLREQIEFWKRRCGELSVIDEEESSK